MTAPLIARNVMIFLYQMMDQIQNQWKKSLMQLDQQISLTMKVVSSFKITPIHPHPTSQIRIIRSSSSAACSIWTIQTYDGKGNAKTVGGDEFYLEFFHDFRDSYDQYMPEVKHPLAVAKVLDREDGTYDLDFITSPIAMERIDSMHPDFKKLVDESREKQETYIHLPGGGNITVHFAYTCDIGRIPPPYKNEWKNGGYSKTSYNDIQIDVAPPVKLFQKPKQVVDLANFDKVILHGDSVMDGFGSHKHTILRSNIYTNGIWEALHSKSWEVFASGAGDAINQVINDLRKNVAASSKKVPLKIGLVMGSGVWDILADEKGQGMEFEDHRKAMRLLISRVQETCSNVQDADVTLIWKSMTSVHPHVVVIKGNRKGAFHRIKYMSSRRSEDLYKFQKEICQEMGVPLLDIYEGYDLSADWHFLNDGRHYRVDMNEAALNWFYSTIEPRVVPL